MGEQGITMQDKSTDEKIYGRLDERIKGIEGKLDALIKLTKRHWLNFAEVVLFEATTGMTKWDIYPTGNTSPILRIEVLTVGGGLTLYINNQNVNQGITCSVGTVIEGVEIYNVYYEVAAGTASILIQSRID